MAADSAFSIEVLSKLGTAQAAVTAANKEIIKGHRKA